MENPPVIDTLVYNEEGGYYEVDSVKDLKKISEYVNAGNTTYNAATYSKLPTLTLIV